MNTDDMLQTTVEALVQPGKAIGVKSTQEHRRRYRSLLLVTAGLGEIISGVILFEETLGQRADDNTLLPVLAA